MRNAVQPLQGKTVLVTRSRKQASELATRIENLGGTVIEFPVIEITPPADPLPMERAIQRITDFDWIVFTSGNGAEFFFRRLTELNKDRSCKAKIAVVGPKTADIVRNWGREPELTAVNYHAVGLVEALSSELTGGESILFPRSSIARPLLVTELKHKGYQVTDIEAYSTIAAQDKLIDIQALLQSRVIDVITFTSSSTVRNFCEAIPKDCHEELLSHVKLVCIGPITASTAVSYHLNVSAVASEHTIPGLVEAVLKIAT